MEALTYGFSITLFTVRNLGMILLGQVVSRALEDISRKANNSKAIFAMTQEIMKLRTVLIFLPTHKRDISLQAKAKRKARRMENRPKFHFFFFSFPFFERVFVQSNTRQS